MQQIIAALAQIANDVWASVNGMSNGVLKSSLLAAAALCFVIPPATVILIGVIDHD